jgi:hypothetical protein
MQKIGIGAWSLFAGGFFFASQRLRCTLVLMHTRLTRKIAIAACGCAVAASASASFASAIGQTITSRVDAASYQHFLDDVLYTHLGMNKGIGGAQHDPCRSAIVAAMQSFGLNVELNAFTYNGTTYYNVIGTKTGTQFPNAQYIIGAHYDTVNNPGADDDSSGVACLLEIARVFAQFDSAYTIKFCAWDREEQGKIGSTAYVNTHPGADIRGMVQIDMIAHDVGLHTEDMWGDANSAPLRTALQNAATSYGNGIIFAYAGNATFSDHAPFAGAGYRAFCFVEHQYTLYGCYHQPCDAVESPDYIQYGFAANLARTIAGWLADTALASKKGDIDANGIVNVNDLLGVINSWGACPQPCPPASNCPADVSPNPGGDCQVNVSDLLMVINNWG